MIKQPVSYMQKKQRFVNLALLAMFGALSLFVAQNIYAQDGTIDQARYETERRIQAEIEQLRQLHSEGRYQEVITHAQRLLDLDASNTAARVWMDRAQEKLDGIESGFPQTERPGRVLVAPEVIDTAPEEEINTAEPEFDYTPVPLAPRDTSSGLAGGLPPMVLIGLGIVAVIFLLVAIFAWLRVRRSQRQLSDAIAEAEKKRSTTDEPTFSDRPTNVHDAVTQVQGVSAPPAYDDDSVMQFGEVGVSDETGEDATGERQESSFGSADMPTQNDLQETTAIQTGEDTQVTGQEITEIQSQQTTQMESMQPESDSFALNSSAEESLRLDDPEEKFSSSILGAPPPEEQETQQISSQQDEGDMTYNSMMFGNQDETVLPGAEQLGPQQSEEDMSFSSMMFSGASETKSPGEETEGETGVEPEKNEEMSFNSLMFSGADETKLPGQKQQDTGLPSQGPPPEGSNDEGDMTFNSMMFGGTDETVAPPGIGEGFEGAVDKSVPLSGGLGSDESTNIIPGMTGDDEESFRIEGEGTEMGSTADKFESEKQAGLGALDSGNYQAAVQSLSVAAGLRPDDNEVSQKLAEARKLRDAQR